LAGRVARKCHNRGPDTTAAQRAHQRWAIHLGHLVVHDQEIGSVGVTVGQGILAVIEGGNGRSRSVARNHANEDLLEAFFVLGNEDPIHTRHRFTPFVLETTFGSHDLTNAMKTRRVVIRNNDLS